MTSATFSILAALGLLGAEPTFDVQTLDGRTAAGTLLEIGPTQLRIQTPQGPVALPLDKLISLAPKSPAGAPSPPGGIHLELVDGSSLVASHYRASAGKARIEFAGGLALEVPTDKIASVRLQESSEPILAEWSRILDLPMDADLLVARQGESIDYYKGALGDVSESLVQFELDGKTRSVKRAKAFGLLYYHPRGAALPDAICRLADHGGSTWAVRTLAIEKDGLRWTTPSGLALTRPLADVARIDFSQGKIVYLSELKPESASWRPYFGMARKLSIRGEFFGPRSDRGLNPGAIELDGKLQPKGLALHSRTELVYRLPGRFQRFKALVGIDDRVKPHGHVRLVIQGDDQVLLETTVAGSEPAARPLDLDVTGVRRLSILVDYGDDMDVADHLDLAEARIVK